MDGVTQRHLLCDAVHSAGSQLPLEGTEMYLFAQMVKSRFCNAGCATVKWHYPECFSKIYINILINAARVADDMAPRAVKNHTRVC